MSTHPKAVGELSEGIILGHLLRKGWPVSLPFGNNQRYDLVVEREGVLLKAQCKTGRFSKGCVVFQTCSRDARTMTRKSYHGQADIFLVYCPDFDAVYLVPVDVTPTTTMHLRVDPPKNAIKATIHYADNYRI